MIFMAINQVAEIKTLNFNEVIFLKSKDIVKELRTYKIKVKL